MSDSVKIVLVGGALDGETIAVAARARYIDIPIAIRSSVVPLKEISIDIDLTPAFRAERYEIDYRAKRGYVTR